MAGGATKESVAREIDPEKDVETKCRLCHHSSQETELGGLWEFVAGVDDVYIAHFFCLMFSAGLKQNGNDDEGIRGFLPPDILKEWRRGQRLKCLYCKKNFATLGCEKCPRGYHLPCALKNGGLLEFCDQFSTFCSSHKPKQNITFIKDSAQNECGVCLQELSKEEEKRWAPCCGGIVHFTCVQAYAKSSGYFFKCPMCNDTNKFPDEMKKFGIFVPEHDAAWEAEPDAFGELLERHGNCDADDCLCPGGRQQDEDYTPWEIVLCSICGSSGIHVSCGGLDSKKPKWSCGFCFKIEKKLPKHHYKPVVVINKQKRRNAALNLNSVKFKLNSENLSVTASVKVPHKSTFPQMTIPICPKYSVTNPVKLSSKPMSPPKEIRIRDTPLIKINTPIKKQLFNPNSPKVSMRKIKFDENVPFIDDEEMEISFSPSTSRKDESPLVRLAKKKDPLREINNGKKFKNNKKSSIKILQNVLDKMPANDIKELKKTEKKRKLFNSENTNPKQTSILSFFKPS